MKKNDKERLDGTHEECHGILGDKSWPKPVCIVKSDIINRKDQDSHITASEFMDEPEVLEKKMEVIAQLIKSSKCCIAYTGAGLSRAAGIGDYASKAEDSVMSKVPKLKSAFDAQPTYSHHILAKLEEVGLLKWYVQQNHDGLPQKAGFPQEKINEIHGAWYDPSNRVVQFKESLRGDLFKWMAKIEEETDLCLCLGTSLSGMNADRCAYTPAENFVSARLGYGTIMINLQKTGIDPLTTIRVWSKLDDAFKILAQKLGLDMTKKKSFPKFKDDIFYIPYDEFGKFLGKNTTKLMKLDFSNNAKLKIVNELSSNAGLEGTIIHKVDDHYTWKCKVGSDQYTNYAIGTWMIDSALRGALDTFPYANLKPTFIDKKFEYKERVREKYDIKKDDSSGYNPDLEDEILKEIEKKSLLEDNYGTPMNEIAFKIGNTFKNGKWKVYIIPNNDFIVEMVKLHFVNKSKKTDIDLQKMPFEYECSGNEEITLEIEIILVIGKTIKLNHKLALNDKGAETKSKFDLDKLL